jgi:hypothetical protein
MALELRGIMKTIKPNRKAPKMNFHESKLSSIVLTLLASANAGALAYSIYLVFAVTV